MNKILLLVCSFTLCVTWLTAQDNVRQRVILIGDAGENSKKQNHTIDAAALRILPGKTTVVYLGDNVYPTGMALPGSPQQAQTEAILQSQFKPMRSKGAPVYFVPGNHDWDKSGPKGLQKIKRQWQYLHDQHDPLLQMVPANGCPDPVAINVSEDLAIIAFDSEWWVFPHDKTNTAGDCSCHTNAEVTTRMQQLMYENRYKTILLADHHPFQSYGPHGGYFSWKDHIFPLTALNKSLYLPLPVIGSLYPLLRRSFVNPEDLRHPLYREMIRLIDKTFEGNPNVIHVSGHEHGLQFIKGNGLQVVSGSGAKTTSVKKGKNALFTQSAGGFVTADLTIDGNTVFTYYDDTGSGAQRVFSFTHRFQDMHGVEKTISQSIPRDSIEVRALPRYDSVSRWHRKLFGENYRRDWGMSVTLPVIRISTVKGGLVPEKSGGGKQSKSLRLKDKKGKEWVLRSVEKYPEVLLPDPLRETFAKDWVNDAMSAQHPYSALVVPAIAAAAGIPHSNPVIGWVAPDSALGSFLQTFANTVCLLEEREPAGKSDNSEEMLEALGNDNDNSLDSTMFLRARILDMFLGDWDRHNDQWRWADQKSGKGKRYLPIPRDRDQVFHLMEGVIPSAISKPWLFPFLHDFDGRIKRGNSFYWASRNLNARFLNQFSLNQWMTITHQFVAAETDSVLEAALCRLPAELYPLEHDHLLAQLKKRRADLPRAMSDYYRFLNRIVDIQTTDKNEFVDIKDAAGGGLQVSIAKLSKQKNIREQVFERIFDPAVTKEIRLFLAKGNDSVVIDNRDAAIRLRIVGGDGHKVYHVDASRKKIRLYDQRADKIYTGKISRLARHLSDDTANTRIVLTNPYHVLAPLINAGFNLDDGLLLGLSLKYTHRGFRKLPFGSVQQVSLVHSFSTSAFRFRYKGEWRKAFGNADFTLRGSAFAPNNTMNFFGTGNGTEFTKFEGYKKYHRSRYSLFEIHPAVRWGHKSFNVSIGPAVQYYHASAEENKGRFIDQPSVASSYDSTSIYHDKAHAGVVVELVYDTKNNVLLPTNGVAVNIKFSGYRGVSNASKSYMRVQPEFSFYKSLNASSGIVLADRFGGALTAGKAAFYQSAFLGGQENLLGYRQFRFAGEQMMYNNLEARIKLANLSSYILPGQVGLTAFYDIGRVWQRDETSTTWHSGAGGGVYFAPAQMAVFQFVMGHSKEGWYPYLTMGLRF